MQIIRYFVAWFLMFILFLGGFSPQAAELAGPPLKTGVGLHSPLNWGHANADRSGYAWPVYDSPEYDVPLDVLRKAKAYGFDFVRLTVDPGPMLAFTGEKRDALDRQLLDDVKAIEQTGLDVIVDFHPIHMVKAYSPDFIESEGKDSLFPAYVAMIGRTAKRLSALDPAHVALEPMNEPQLGYSPVSRRRWQGMMERLYDAARAQAPTLTIIATGCEGGGIEGLEYLDPRHFRSGPARYSFHYYTPLLFTHEGVRNPDPKSLWTYVTGLPYPAKLSERDAFIDTVRKRIEEKPGLTAEQKALLLGEARRQLAIYFDREGTHAFLESEFARAAKWAQINHIDPKQLFLGEFNATQKTSFADGAHPADRLRWLTDVRTEAEKYGFGWCLWALNGLSSNGMLLVNPDTQSQIDVPTAKALGKQVVTP